jgi:preprotein translocase subunit SecG
MSGMVKNKRTVILLYLFIMITLTLGVMNGYLYKENKSIRTQNRALIIQNDSILSINLNLKEELRRHKFADFAQIRKN